MKYFLFFIAGALVTTLLIAGTSVAFAQTPPPPTTENQQSGFTPGMPGRSWMRRAAMVAFLRAEHFQGNQGPLHEFMVASLAEELGMSVADFESAIASEKTLRQIADDQGFSTTEQFNQLITKARKNAILAAVEAGVITQEQANWMIERMDYRQANRFKFGDGMNFREFFRGRWNRMPGWHTFPQTTPTP